MKIRAGIEVVAQKADAGAEHDGRQHRGVDLPERKRDHAERQTRDRRDACREAVETVEEVEHVHDRDDPDDRERDPDA